MAILNARLASEADAEVFQARPADRLECENYGLTVCEAIKMSLENSVFAHTVEVDGEVAGMWGYGSYSLTSGVALGWLMTTSVVDRYPKLFIKTSRTIVSYILERYPILRVLVDERHEKAITWLRFLGFEYFGLDDRSGFIYMQKVR